MIRRVALVLCLSLCGTACSEPPPPALPTADLAGTCSDGATSVSVRWEPSPPPFNEPFAVRVRLERDGVALEGAYLGVSAWMPGHGHGMLRYPRVTELGGGDYRAEGMLLHMRGDWELRLDVVVDALATQAVLPFAL